MEASLSACFLRAQLQCLWVYVDKVRVTLSYEREWRQLHGLYCFLSWFGSPEWASTPRMETPTFALLVDMFPVCIVSMRWELRGPQMLEQTCSCFEVHLFDWGNFPSIFRRWDKEAWGNDSTCGSKFLLLLTEQENITVFLWFYNFFFFFFWGILL